jgi:hypothetical protein
MALPAFLAGPVNSWAAYYEAHRMVSVAVRWVHLGGLIVGGGTALAADRHVFAGARAGAGPREASLAELDGSHRVVVPALALVVLTGLLMTASDTATFLNSRLYWMKMGLVALLLLNGTGLLAAERAAKRGRVSGWSWLALVSGVSFVLWLVILFFGVWLTAAA